MFTFDAAAAARIIEEESALGTLRGYPIEEVLAAIDGADTIDDEESAFNALMSAMYSLRPVGYL
jgi:hypothetical protein